MSDTVVAPAPSRTKPSVLLGAPDASSAKADDGSAAPPPAASPSVRASPHPSAPQPSALGAMSHTDLRGGLEMLRAQVGTLQDENDTLKQSLSQLERERDADVRRIRHLMGKSMVRQHCSSWKLRKMLISLHIQVLNLAEQLNREQRIAEQQENRVASVQGEEGETVDGTHLSLAPSSEQLAAEHRAHFLASLNRLRPSRVGKALKDNLERLFESMHDVLARCPKYRSELDFSFHRNIELKEELLQAEHNTAAERERGSQLELQMQQLADETEVYKQKNLDLARDMRLTLDIERRRRLRENQQYIKARTSLYKKILADKDSPLHPAQLAKVGKNGTNMLNALAGQHQQRGRSESPAEQRARAQREYYEERRLAAQQAEEEEAAYQAAQQKLDDALYREGEHILPPKTAEERAAEAAALARAAMAARDFSFPSDGLGFLEKRVDPSDPMGRSEDMNNYRFKPNEKTPRPNPEEDEEDEKQHLPPITPRSRLLAASASMPKLPAPQGKLYAADLRAQAAYRASNEWMRQQALAAKEHRFAQMAAANAAAAAAAAATNGETSPSVSPQRTQRPKSTASHSSPSCTSQHPALSFPAAQRIFSHRVGVGGNSETPRSGAAGNGMDTVPEWVENFASPAAAAAAAYAAHQAQAGSSGGLSPERAAALQQHALHTRGFVVDDSPPAAVLRPLHTNSTNKRASGGPLSPASVTSPSSHSHTSHASMTDAEAFDSYDATDGSSGGVGSEVIVSTSVTSTSMFKYAASNAAGGSGAQAGSGAALASIKSAYPRGSSMSRRAPAPASAQKKAAHSDAMADLHLGHLKTIPPSPRRDGGLF